MKTEIAKAIEHGGAMIRYDAQCKKVLSNTYILAWIMQAAIVEYGNMTVNEIRQCIEHEPEIGNVSIDLAGVKKEKIYGLNTEDKDAVEGEIHYDIRFAAYIPKEKNRIKILINVEAQKDFYPGYPISTRGIYYGARMISSQNGIEFFIPHYGDIKKVYSIWVCTNSPKYIGNAISIYEIQKRDVVGHVEDTKENYDKMSVIMICLNDTVYREKGFFDMIHTLLSPTIETEKKKDILSSEYQIPMERGLMKEVELMCNLSQWVLNKGIEQGIQESRNFFVVNLIKEGTVSDEFIMKMSGVTKEELEHIKESLYVKE